MSRSLSTGVGDTTFFGVVLNIVQSRYTFTHYPTNHSILGFNGNRSGVG